MKKIVAVTLLLLAMISTEAQIAKQKKTPSKSYKVKTTTSVKKDQTVVLTNTSDNKAYAASAINRLQIADTTINLMNQRAVGANINLSSSGIAGMPKGTYGFANGKIWLRNTTATTSGSAYGSGSVGTGTSVVSAGTSEATIGVNGKSPDAGVHLWGDKRPVLVVPFSDSLKKQ